MLFCGFMFLVVGLCIDIVVLKFLRRVLIIIGICIDWLGNIFCGVGLNLVWG